VFSRGGMRRRNFITLLGSTMVMGSLTAHAQQSGRMRRIGVLMSYAESDALAQIWFKAFLEEMQAVGWIDGRNVRLDVRWAGGDTANRLQEFAKELVDLQPDVLFAETTPSLKAVLRESRTVPIVFTQVTDPVAQGLIESLPHPGGNITGFTNFEREIASKLMQVLKDIAPRTTRVAVMFNPDTAPYYKLYMSAIEVAAASFAMKAFEAAAHSRAEIETVLSALTSEPTVGVIPIPDIFTTVNRDMIIALSARYRLPAIYFFDYCVTDGGLISYGIDVIDMQRRAAGYVDRILKGAKPADLPVQLPTKYRLTINLKTAKVLGITVPQAMLARADEVIE
jgi:putative tryptophan/tyrosine transport system substrate-binding protein